MFAVIIRYLVDFLFQRAGDVALEFLFQMRRSEQFIDPDEKLSDVRGVGVNERPDRNLIDQSLLHCGAGPWTRGNFART